MNINPTTLQAFRSDFQQAVKALEEKYGVTVQAQKITYDSGSFHFKVEVNNGSAEEAAKNHFENHCELYGLEPSDYLKTFTWKGNEYQIVGIKPSGKKNNIIIKDTHTNTEYVGSSAIVLAALKRKPRLTEVTWTGGLHHSCKCCGKKVPGGNQDLLCGDCMETYGHCYYSEL